MCLWSFLPAKKDPPPPPSYNPPVAQGRLLNYADDAPISDATIELFYTYYQPVNPNEVVTTDADGFFNYKYLKDTPVIAIPAKEGWWCPFQYGYSLNLGGDAFENDSIIYLFQQDTVKVHVHIQTPLELPFTGKFKVSDMVLLPKLNTEGYWPIDEWFSTSTDTSTYTTELTVILGVKNSLWFSKERYSYFSNDKYYALQDSIVFFSEPSNDEPEFNFYY